LQEISEQQQPDQRVEDRGQDGDLGAQEVQEFAPADVPAIVQKAHNYFAGPVPAFMENSRGICILGSAIT
jgi:hypothetical protein